MGLSLIEADRSMESLDLQSSARDRFTKVNVVKLFNKLNYHLFNDDIKGITVKWSSNIKSHTSVSMQRKSLDKETVIFLSISLLSKCTRKQLIESLLYEMIFLYVMSSSRGITEEDAKANHIQALMKFAMDYVNNKFGLHLTFNYPLRAHKTVKSSSNWVDVDDDIVFNQLNDTFISISDDDSDCEDFQDIRDSVRFKDYELVSKTITLQDLGHMDIDCCCCINYSAKFSSCFASTHFRKSSILDVLLTSACCPCCSKCILERNMNDHFNKCSAFEEES